MSSWSSWLKVLFRSCIAWLIFCALTLQITEWGVLKPPTLIVNLCVSPSGLISFYIMNLEALLLVACLFRIFVFLENDFFNTNYVIFLFTYYYSLFLSLFPLILMQLFQLFFLLNSCLNYISFSMSFFKSIFIFLFKIGLLI